MLRNQPCPAIPYIGEFHRTAFRTEGTARLTITSMRRAASRFQPDNASMYACTGASPSALAICGFPPDSSFGFGVFLEEDFRTAETSERAVFFEVFFCGLFGSFCGISTP